MEQWQYRFGVNSPERWLAQVNAELKGKTIDSLSSEWWPGEMREPVHHAQDGISPVYLHADLFSQPPAIIEQIDTYGKSLTTIQKEILTALSFGAQSIYLKNHDQNTQPLSDLLKDVEPDFVKIIIASNDDHIFESNNLHKNIFLRKNFAFADKADLQEHVQYSCQLSTDGNWTDVVIETLKPFFQKLNNSKDKRALLQQTVIEISPSSDYLKTIIQTRVLHKVVEAIFSYAEAEYEPSAVSIEHHISNKENLANDQYVLFATTSAVAASLSGGHGMMITSPASDAPGYYNRIVRNIHHLLAMESEIYRQTDPLAGSFTIDHYTHRWTDMIVRGVGIDGK